MNSNKIIVLLFLMFFVWVNQAHAVFSWEGNLVAHYKMNDNSDATSVVIDSMGYSNGTFSDASGNPNTNAHSTTGKLNGALIFDGADDYVDTNSFFNDIFNGDFSIALWVRPDDGDPGATLVAFWGAWNDEAQYRPQIEIHLRDGGIIYFEGRTSKESADGGFDVYSSSVFSDGPQDWHFIVCTGTQDTATTATFNMYFDNVLVGTQTLTQVLSEFEIDANMYIGAVREYDPNEGWIADELFPGGIDNLMVFNKALLQDEITFLYNSGNGIEDIYAITGQITLIGGSADVTDVFLTLSGDTSDITNPDADGNYSLTGVQGGNYTITPALAGYTFFPLSYSYTSLDSNQTKQNFIGRCISSSSGGRSNCFIATVAYGTPMAEEVKILSEFRDEYLLANPIGERFVATYYEVSPNIASFIREHPILKKIVRITLNPLIWMSEKSIE